MDIISCIKSVKAEFVNNEKVNSSDYELNPYDVFALENVIDLKSKVDCNITCISMGGEVIKNSLIKAYAMGADKVVWLKDSAFAGADTVATTYILSKAIENLPKFDLIVCGGRAVDGETGQVSPGLAERLNIKYVSGVKEMLKANEESIVLRRSFNDYEEVVKVNLPAVIAFDEFTTNPKSIGLVALKRAQRKNIDLCTAESLKIDKSLCGLNGSKTKVLSGVSNFEKKDAERIVGEPNQAAELIFKLATGKK